MSEEQFDQPQFIQVKFEECEGKTVSSIKTCRNIGFVVFTDNTFAFIHSECGCGDYDISIEDGRFREEYSTHWVASVSFPEYQIKQWRKSHHEKMREVSDAREKAEYDRLKAKFEPNGGTQ